MLLPESQSKKMTLLRISHNRELAYLDNDSPAVFVQKFQLGPLGFIANSYCFEKREFTWASWEWPLIYLSWLISFQTNHRGALLCPIPFTGLCLPFLTPQPCLPSVENCLCSWAAVHDSFTADIILELHWILTSSPQRRRTHMRMLIWSERVWVGSLGPPWTGSWTLHLR